MKRKLQFVLFVLLTNILQAQGQVLTSESFDGSINWHTEIIDSTTNWEFATAGGYPDCAVHSTPGMGRFDSYNAENGSSAIMVSPAFDLSDSRGEVKFWMYRSWGAASPKVEVYISTDDSTSINATLIGSAYYHYPEAPASEEIGWYEFTLQIPESYNSDENYLILKAISSGSGGMMYIDDISVNAVPKKDASITTITSPVNGSKKGQHDVTVTLKNKGSENMTSCNILYNINGITGSYNWSGNLDYLACEDVTISTNFDFPGGNNSVLVWSDYTDDGDSSNDTLDLTLSFSPLPLPYIQKFDSENDFSSMKTASYGSYNWEFSSENTYSAPGAAKYESSWSSNGNWTMLVTPAFDLSVGPGVLNFRMYRDSCEYLSVWGDGEEEILEVYISTDDTTSSGAALLASIHRDRTLDPVVEEDGWYEYRYALPDNFKTDENYLIFKAYSDYGNDMYIDDISIVPSHKVTYRTNGFGIVTSRQNTIIVDSGGYVDYGCDVVFTATPDEYYQVKQWLVNGVVINDYNKRTYIVSDISESIDIYVEFEAIKFPVNYTITGSEGLLTATVSDTLITSGSLITGGSAVLFNAIPPDHCRVKKWTVNDTEIPDYTDNSYFCSELDDTIDVTVEFELATYPVNYSVFEGEGAITASVNGESINSGDKIIDGSGVVFTASPKEHYCVKQWVINDSVVTDHKDTQYTVSSLNDTINLTVEFEKLQVYEVTFSTNGNNGTLSAEVADTSITSGNMIDKGSEIVFTANPNKHYKVKQWMVNDSVLTNYTAPSYSYLDLNEPINVKVEYEVIKYEVTFSVIEGNGTISAKTSNAVFSSGDSISEGSQVEFTANPDNGYGVSTWLVNNVEIIDNTSPTYTISSISEITDVKVKFGNTSSITSFSGDNIGFYPNPTTNGFYFNTNKTETVLLKIYNAEGQIVLSNEASNGDYIDVSKLEQGIYIIKTEKYSSKLIIE
jgi:hypothetical protein